MNLGSLFVIFYLVGIYTNLHLLSGEKVLIPYFIAGIAAFFLLLKNYKRIRVSHLKSIALILSIVWFTVFIKGNDGFFVERIKTGIQIAYSIVLAYGFFLEISRWSRQRVASLFYYICIIIIIGCILESFTPFKALSDAFRHAVYHSGIYDAYERDLAFFGRERPKLFTSEPSHVSKFLLFSLTMWLALAVKNTKLYYKAAVLSLSGVFVTGSPGLILIAPIGLAIAVFLEGNGVVDFLKKLNTKRLLLSFALLFLVLTFLITTLTTVLSSRVASMFEGEGSTVTRIVAPPFITFDVLKEYPMWGTGIGGKELITNVIFERLRYYFDLRYIQETEDAEGKLVNAFWMHWIYFGLVGGILMVWANYKFIKSLGAKHISYCFIVIIIFTQTMGGYSGARLWAIVTGIIITSVLLTKEEKRLT